MTDNVTPLYFPSGEQSLFGWLHEPTGEVRSDIGVVICKPFGYEAICAHRSLRAFADACAAMGVTALRFDYSGTGDSSGADGAGDQIAAWSADVGAAVAALRRIVGVTRVCLLGVRLGALLASRVAAEHKVDALIAVAPVVNGRRYVRELRAFQASAALDSTASPSLLSTVTAPQPVLGGGALEVTGFSLSAASVESLQRIDFKDVTHLPARSALILDRSDLPTAKQWADALLGLGADVRYRALPGYLEMVSTPHAAEVPREMVAATVEWLDRFQFGLSKELSEHSGTWVAPTLPPPQLALPEPVMQLKAEDGTALIERALFIDTQRLLFAIVTEPAVPMHDAAGTRYGAVMLNGGATSHIGPNRMYVDLARRWAARGYAVLRLDLAGIGDSATRPGQAGNEVYPLGAITDVTTAVEYLRREYGVTNMTLAGLCAGAYHALRSATAGLPVSTVLMVNPLTFYWTPGSTLNDVQISEVVRNPGVYAERILVRSAWLRVLRGKVNLRRVAVVFLRRAWLAFDSSVRDLARLLHIRLPNDLGRDLQSIASRGVRMVFLFARGDAGAALLKVQGGSAVKSLGDHCRVYTIDGADHIFTQSAPRAELLQLLSSELPK